MTEYEKQAILLIESWLLKTGISVTGTTPAFNSAATPGIEHRELSAFMSAASSGDVAGMQAYIDKYGRENVDAIRGEPQAYTPLMWAAKAGNVIGIAFSIFRIDSIGENNAFCSSCANRFNNCCVRRRIGFDTCQWFDNSTTLHFMIVNSYNGRLACNIRRRK